MASQKYRVLFFIRGPVPTDAQRAEALTYGPSCGFRNVHHLHVGDCVEPCDAIAGDAPAEYVKAYPRAVPFAARGEPAEASPRVLAPTPAGDPFVAPSGRQKATLPPPNWTPQG